jgi:hypothetical protein
MARETHRLRTRPADDAPPPAPFSRLPSEAGSGGFI